ncbi:PREDICTED: sorting nexin-6-like [Tinamus guttatus]|uniref:sorting nexin-6-like n=1 Tax=Tinamus guttatus TaxID=94827 RepID=UPI00052EDC52|nr:PREDICTED: sorting nexin-6-like [Tinamus guttatus]
MTCASFLISVHALVENEPFGSATCLMNADAKHIESLVGASPLELRAINVDLQTDAALQVDISDALSERDKVKFTVHTKSSLPNFKQNEFSVVRQHEEFIWLHDSFVENEDYAGYIIPPAPPRPDFDASREKLQKLGEGEGSMTKEEFTKMKQELEAGWITQKTWGFFYCHLHPLHPPFLSSLNDYYTHGDQTSPNTGPAGLL